MSLSAFLRTRVGLSVVVAMWCSVLGIATVMVRTEQVSASPLTSGFTYVNADFAMFGVGGLRGSGVGSIAVTGISGTVLRAELVWHGVSSSSLPVSATATVNGSTVTGTNIGLSSDNCWSQKSSQAFRADVTSLVTGNGTVSLTGMMNSTVFDPNGATLFLSYDNGNPADNRDVAGAWGNDSNQPTVFDPAGWSASFSGFNYNGGTASLRVVASDGQNSRGSGTNPATVNGVGVTLPLFQGNTVPTMPGSTVSNGGLWDHVSVSLGGVLAVGSTSLALQSAVPDDADCLSLVAAIVDFPANSFTAPAPAPAPVAAPPTTFPELLLVVVAPISTTTTSAPTTTLAPTTTTTSTTTTSTTTTSIPPSTVTAPTTTLAPAIIAAPASAMEAEPTFTG